MTKTLKDWPSNCEADFFDALGEPGSRTFFDFTKDKDFLIYYARFHNPETHESHVIPETDLVGFSEALEKDFKTHIQGNFLGLCVDLEEIWWPEEVGEERITPVPRGIVGAVEEYDLTRTYERAKIVFYEIQKAPEGWVFSSNPGHFQVKPIREWILDYTIAETPDLETDSETDPEMPDLETVSDTETDPESPDDLTPPESVYYRNQIFPS